MAPVQQEGGIPGGFNASRDPTDEEVTFLTSEAVRRLLPSTALDSGDDAEGKPKPLEVVKVKSQVVAGMNHQVKFKVGSNSYGHAKIFRPLPCNGDTPELQSYEEGKTLEDEL